jgi:basic membrane protein A
MSPPQYRRLPTRTTRIFGRRAAVVDTGGGSMRTRFLGLTLLMTLALGTAACTGGGGGSQAPSGSGLKIGFVTDVGTLEDKSFNEAAWLAVQDAKTKYNAEIDNIVTKDTKDYATNIKAFVDRGYQIIVTSGFAMGDATTIAAKQYPNVKFIGTDQGVCIDEQGAPDPTFACKGDPATLLPNRQGIVYNEAQAGYLAGVLAASITKTNVIGTLGGINSIPPVVKYIRGYINGAKATNSSITVLSKYYSTDIAKAFNDSAGGKSVGQQMIGQKADVLFQVAGLTGAGFLEAACDAKVWGIGVDVDQWAALPNLQSCIVTSAEKHLRISVLAAIDRVQAKTDKGGTISLDAASDPVGVGVSDFHNHADLVNAETQKKIDDALAAMKAGSVDACGGATNCGDPKGTE